MDDHGDGDHGDLGDPTLPSSPPVIGPPASPFQPSYSSATEYGDHFYDKSHFWDSPAAEPPSHGKRRAAKAPSLAQAKRQCVQGVSTDAPTPDPTSYQDLEDDRGTVPEPDTSAETEDEDKLPYLPRPNTAPSNPGSDNYGFTSSVEEGMAKLADPFPATLPQRPPWSVIREMAPVSDVYDFALQRSPPGQTITLSKAASAEEDLMDYEMDWHEILKSNPPHPKGSSVLENSDRFVASAAAPAGITNTTATRVLQTTQVLPASRALEQTQEIQGSYNSQAIQQFQAPQKFHATQATNYGPTQTQFVRPPFPSPVKDKSPILGLSKSVVVQICFRIGELVNRASKCRSANQHAIFELYARVKSSFRDSSGRVQHFEFMDLFKSYPPHLAGTLSGWKEGSLVDEQSAAFLAITEPKMCRCICKMKKVTKNKNTSWVVEVISIRETIWDNVDWIKATAFRGQ